MRRAGRRCIAKPSASGSARERPSLRPLPALLPAACVRRIARINKFAEAGSAIPTATLGADPVGTPRCGARTLRGARSRHHRRAARRRCDKRCTGKHQTMLDVRHAIELLALKHRSVERAEIIGGKENFRRRCWPCEIACWLTIEPEQAAPLWRFYACCSAYSSEVVGECVSQALICGTLDPAAIALLVRQRTAPLLPAAPILALRAPDGMQRPGRRPRSLRSGDAGRRDAVMDQHPLLEMHLRGLEAANDARQLPAFGW